MHWPDLGEGGRRVVDAVYESITVSAVGYLSFVGRDQPAGIAFCRRRDERFLLCNITNYRQFFLLLTFYATVEDTTDLECADLSMRMNVVAFIYISSRLRKNSHEHAFIWSRKYIFIRLFFVTRGFLRVSFLSRILDGKSMTHTQ